jgi:hypothetical protein
MCCDGRLSLDGVPVYIDLLMAFSLWDLDHTVAPVMKFQERGHTDIINAVEVS